MKRLADLLRDVPFTRLAGTLDIPIRSIASDSRAVGAGDVFVCLPGYRTEGGETRADRHDFIASAIERGATALIVDRDIAVSSGVTVVRVPDCWVAIAAMAC